MGGGFATIPQIAVDVPVSTTPPRQARVAPQIASPDALAEGQVGEGLGKLGDILAVQYQHKQILDGEFVTEGVRNKFAELRAQNASLPGDQQAATFQQQSNDIVKAAVNDPANSHIKGYLQSELPKQQGLYYRDAVEAGAHQTMQEQTKQALFMGKQTADTAGANYTIDAKGNFTDGPLAQAAEQKYFNTINALYGKNPNTVSDMMAAYNQAKVEKRVQSVAVNNPDQLKDYLKTLPPGMLDGQQESAALSLANTTMSQAAKQLDIAYGASRAQEVAYQNQYIQQHGQPDMARANAALEGGKWDGKDFANVVGRDYEKQTPPSVQSVIEHRIQNISSIDDADNLKADIQAGVHNKEINGGDGFRYESMIAQQVRQIKTPAGQANITALGQLKANYMPSSPADGRLIGRIQGVNPFAQAAAKAEMIYRASVYGHPAEPPQFYIDKMQAAEKAVPRPVRASSTPPPPPPKVPDALAAAYADYLRRHPERAP
jgi:hypothetical protein